ncbi:MAG: ABC transporter substrate-binding protein, partial [Bacteroidales bacterium]|nr:ABC transporter substrate-binding protein [Bacteroidales bacterium]
MKIIFLFCSIALIASCGNRGSKGESTFTETGVKEENSYAKFFEITNYSNCKVISVINPWDTTRTLQEYVLVDKNIPLPDGLPKGTVIRTPVENVIMYSTIHASIWEKLGALESVVGICEPEYLTSERAKRMMAEGKIHNCGMASSPNVEKIMDIGGRFIVASPFENGGYGQAGKLGIPIFESADYMENHPLGRVEWMKVFGMLSGKKDTADSLYRDTEAKYNSLKALAAGTVGKPRIMSERKYGSSWFIVGGASYIAQMYKDAGADYIFNDNNETGSVPVAFETVFDKGADSDMWVFKYAADRPMTYAGLEAEYKPYANFAPFKNRKIYTCNTVDTPY